MKGGRVSFRPQSLSPREICQSNPVFCDRHCGMSMFSENSANQSSSILIVPLLPVPPGLEVLPFLNHQFLLLKALQRVSPSHLCCWFCGGLHLLWVCPCGPVPSGNTIQPHMYQSPHPTSTPIPAHASVPQVDGPPDSPALHRNTGIDESDQGYNDNWL